MEHQVSPGKVLKHILNRRNITSAQTAWAAKVPKTVIDEIIDERREVTPEVALKLAYVFDVRTEDLYGKPRDAELEKAKEDLRGQLGLLRPFWKR